MRTLSLITLLAGTTATMACARHVLEPKAGAKGVVLEDDTITNRQDGIQLTAGTEWHGERDVLDHVTPVRVAIENNSNHHVRVRYDDFTLVARDGQTYRALPPYSIEGTVDQPVLAPPRGYGSGTGFDWYHGARGFYVAPYAGTLYGPGAIPYVGTFGYDPGYYNRYFNAWAEVPLPTTYMLQKALPEGVLEPGGVVAGWLYFEEVSENPERVIDLAFNLVSVPPSARHGGTEGTTAMEDTMPEDTGAYAPDDETLVRSTQLEERALGSIEVSFTTDD